MRQRDSRPRSSLTGLLLAGLLLNTCVSADTGDVPGWAYDGIRNGLEWSNPDTGSYLWLGLRFQTRYSDREDEPLVPDDLRKDGSSGFDLNRARYKIGAGLGLHFTFYHEYDLRNGKLLDLRGTWKPAAGFNLRAGQWKSEFNRERVDSSGKQQFVERSIVNYWFTVDRQNGVMASGLLFPDQRASTSWWLGVLNGNGLNSDGDGGRPMVVGRAQWNFYGRVLPFSQSAVKRYQEPRGSLAFGFVTNDSPYTRFSSSGGGELPGYSKGVDNQYRIEQRMLEFAWQLRGWSVQSEFHSKRIEDRINGGAHDLHGGYLQGGWFLNEQFERWPRPLELAARIALVSPGRDQDNRANKEYTLAANWFFNGHRNKLTVDLAYLKIREEAGSENDWRFRLQWDISL